MQSLSLHNWRQRTRNSVKSQAMRRINFQLSQAIAAQNEAKQDVTRAFHDASAADLSDDDLREMALWTTTGWAARAATRILARVELFTDAAALHDAALAAAHAADEAAERVRAAAAGEEPNPGVWEVSGAARRRQRREARTSGFGDLVSRFLHARNTSRHDSDAPDAIARQAAAAAAPDSERDQAEAEEGVAAEAARRDAEDPDAEDVGAERADNTVVDEGAVAAARAAELAAEGGGAAAGGTAPMPDAEIFGLSDEDVAGGGRARAAHRRGQRVLSLHDLRSWSDTRDPWELSLRNRHELVALLRNARIDAGRAKLAGARATYAAAGNTIADLEMQRDSAILRSARVIGLTTTGAARARRLLEAVAPTVLVVEEAAEVLESHILAALVPSIQHAVLIGDHQQLRPKVESFELARHHALSVSMFERLINNGVPHATLDTQHRMRPEFAALLTPAIYPRLLNAEATRGRPPIPGVGCALFFTTHDAPETSAADRGGFGGYANAHEAELVIAFAEHLLRNGVKPLDIVVLVAYQSQATLVREHALRRTKALRAALERGGVSGASVLGLDEPQPFAPPPAGGPPLKRGLDAVRVSTIDNYQGEEARVVLLSLVRSSPSTTQTFKGFMRESNRVCVALSRARDGFFIFGNGTLHGDSTHLWAQVIEKLDASGAYGPALPLKCFKHPDRRTAVRVPADFLRCAGGGCALPCEARLDCGHVCPQTCHPDNHDYFRCAKPCARVRPCGHGCGKACWVGCGECMVPVERRLPCGHSARLPCSASIEGFHCKEPCGRSPHAATCGHACQAPCGEPCPPLCGMLVDRRVPSCASGHMARTLCCEPPPASCPAPCSGPLRCGHTCSSTCGGCAEIASAAPLALRGEDGHAPCRQRCSRVGICGHQCNTPHPCNTRCPPCRRPCETRCEHSRCGEPCAAPCAPCAEPCRVRCPHTACALRCSEPCARAPCDLPCTKSLRRCGHSCIGLCGEQCPTLCRICDPAELDVLTQERLGDADAATRFVQLECGHIAAIELLDGWMDAQDPAAPHEEGGGARAIKLPQCPACRSPVRRSFRYAAIVRRAIIELEAVKRRLWAGPELRDAIFAKIDLRRRGEIEYAAKSVDARIADSPRSATAHAVRGELAMALAAISAPDQASMLRELARAAFEESLRLLGRNDRGEPAAPAVVSIVEPVLGPRDAARECFVALRGLGLLLLRAEGMAEAAKIRLLAAKAAGHMAGLNDAALDVDAALADVAGAERQAVTGAIAGMGGGGSLTWYTCPNGHRYAVGECGAGMQLSQCPDCGARIGGQNHEMAAGNRAIGAPSPYARAALEPPPEELVRRLQLQ